MSENENDPVDAAEDEFYSADTNAEDTERLAAWLPPHRIAGQHLLWP